MYASRVAHHRRPWRNISGNDTACADHCIITDAHPWKNDGTATNPCTITNSNILTNFNACLSLCRI